MLGGDSTLQIIIKAVDQATGVFKSVQQAVERQQRSFADTAAASQKFAIGLGVAATAAGGLGYAALKAAGDMEQTSVAFTTMLGSGEKAQQFIQQLIQFAKTTPFTLVGLEQASKQLLAYGFAQEEVIPNLTALGNIAAGVGMDKLPNLILAFGQVKAATHLTGMELRQFTEAGVPLLDALSKQLHVSVADLQDMISKGEVGFPAVQAALASLSGEGGRFNNLMEKQSHTLEGMLSNLQDAWNIFLTGEGQKLLEWAKKFTEAAIYVVQNVLPAWVDRVSQLIDFFDRHQAAIYIVAGAIVGALVPAIWAAVVAFGALMVTLAPFIIGGAIIGGIVAGIVWIVQNWDMLKAKAAAVWGAITSTIQGAFQGIEDFVMAKIQAVIDAYNRMVEIVSKPIKIVTNAASSVGNFVSNALSSLPHFEQGGVVPGAVGTAVPIIAHGQETVMPAGAASSGGGDISYTINISNPQVRSRADIDILRQEIEEALRDVSRGHKLATI
ncbi:MAG: hypothetical protein BGP12_06900 [Rhodospirillales bacterium 70-18]|nr:MAG: hypothetical protein BGP12_06900 [Rhodospirillales bacterium 70-18]